MIIWIASYPKSGNTWLRSLISSYLYSKNGEFNFNLLKNIRQFPFNDTYEKYKNNYSSPSDTIKFWIDEQTKLNSDRTIKFLKTHSAFFNIDKSLFTNSQNSLGAIYIVRDPRNILTSLSNHYQIEPNKALEFMNDTNRCLVKKKDNEYSGYIPLFSWALHEKSWSECSKIPILTIRYEDLIDQTFATFQKVILFVKGLTNNKITFNREKLKKSIASCQFSKLQKLEEKKGFSESSINLETNEKVKFFNLGEKNNYQKLLSTDLVDQLTDLYKEQLKKYRYE